MKKAALILPALILCSSMCFAQGFYVRAGFGYALPQAGQTIYDTPIPYNDFPTGISGTRGNTTPGSNTYNIKGASFSSGVQAILGLGYMFSKNAGVQLDGFIGVASKKYSFVDQNVTLNLVGGGTILTNITTNQQAKTPFILSPSLVLQTGGEKVNLYSRFGVALPLKTKVTQEQIIANVPGTGMQEVENYSWQIKSSFSLGFTAAAGLKYKINDAISIWGELSLLSMSAFTKQQDLQSITVNGRSYSVNSYPYATSIKFSKNAVTDTNFSQFPTYAQPFSNIGINIGVSFKIGGNTSRHSTKFNSEGDQNKPYRRR